MEVIIFGSDCTNSLGLVQCLGMEGISVSALIFGQKTGLVESSRFCKSCFYFSVTDECIRFLLNYHPSTDQSCVIIPSSDISAFELNGNRTVLMPKYTFGHIIRGSSYKYHELLNKSTQLSLAQNAGIVVPKLYKSYSLPVDHPNDEDIERYPCIIKPQISKDGCKGDLRICRCFQDVVDNISSLQISQKVIVEQYIDRDYEISILGVALRSGEIIMPAIEEKLTLYPKYVGLECLAKIRTFEPSKLKNQLIDFVKSTGYVGLFSIEMMHNIDDGEFYFTEINLRNDGANSFIFKSGVNLPLIHLYDMQKCNNTQFCKDVCEHKTGYYIWDFHHLKSLLHKDISVTKWLSEILKSRGFLSFFRNDPMPFFKQYINWLLRKL